MLRLPAARLPLLRVAARVHAGCVGFAVSSGRLLVLVQAIERPAASAHEATDDRPLAGTAPASNDGAARRADCGTRDGADRASDHGILGVLTLAGLADVDRLLVALPATPVRHDEARH